MRSEDLAGQREALTEDVEDTSGGEQDTPGEQDKKNVKQQTKTLRDSALPAVMIAALLLTFAALAGTAIFVVSRAFGEDGEDTHTVLPTSSPSLPVAHTNSTT